MAIEELSHGMEFGELRGCAQIKTALLSRNLFQDEIYFLCESSLIDNFPICVKDFRNLPVNCPFEYIYERRASAGTMKSK